MKIILLSGPSNVAAMNTLYLLLSDSKKRES